MATNFANLTSPQQLSVFDLVLGNTTSATQGAGAIGAGFNLNYAAGTIGQRLGERISPTSFPWLAKFDGVTDDGAAINACLSFAATNKLLVEMPSGVAITSITISQPAGLTITGAGCGGYTALTGLGNGATIIQTTAANVGWSIGQGGVTQDIQLRIAGYGSLAYSIGTYPAGSGNTPFGFTMAQGAITLRCVAFGFSAGGFVPQGATFHIQSCYAFQNSTGLLVGGAASSPGCTIANGVMTVPAGAITGTFAANQTLNFIPSQNTATSCTIAANVLTAGGTITGDNYSVGQQLIGAGIPAGITISSFGTGTGGAGTYNLSIASGTIPTISTPQTIYAVGQCTGVTISSLGTGTGGAGTYNLSIATLNVSGARVISTVSAATDGWVTESVFMFNAGSAGIDSTAGGYCRFTSNRIEWNARYGVISPGEANGVANVFDRNGWSGLYMLDGNWGQSWAGNYFSRNGCGGDPNQGFGRWGFSTPTDPSWVPTPAWESCHLKLGFQRRVAFAGNVFRPGRSDASDGAQSPAFIYQFDGASGSTPVTDIRIRNNSGDQQDTTPGFNVNAYGSIGAIATGSDTFLASCFSSGWELGAQVTQTNMVVAQPTLFSATTSKAFQVPKGYGGFIQVTCRAASSFGGCVILFGQDASGGNKTASIPAALTIGTALSGATVSLTSGTAPYDTVTLTLTGSFDIRGTIHAS